MPRPPKRRIVENLPEADYYKPAGVPLAGLEEVVLSVDELEAMRLKDHEGLDHASSAARMQVSRPTFHRILRAAHHKVADALVQGKAIRIHGGAYRLMGRHHCEACGGTWHDEAKWTDPCPQCGAETIVAAAVPRGRRHRHRGPHRRGKQ